jgi:KUP system potassium uptake protein
VSSHKNVNALTAGGVLVSLGIVFGDIGTSPLYTLKAIFKSVVEKGHALDPNASSDIVLGALSCIIWTLTLQTTIKYVMITLRADNKGEGGIFSLYSLVRKKAKWLVIPAIIGGAALLADGMITPSITVTSAIEGLQAEISPMYRFCLLLLRALLCAFMYHPTVWHEPGWQAYLARLCFLWFAALGVAGMTYT